TLSVKLIDLAGNEVISNVGNPAITVDYVLPSFTSVAVTDPDEFYMDGDTIGFDIDMSESNLTLVVDLTVLDTDLSSTQSLTDDTDGTYSHITAALASATMVEGVDTAVTITATDSAGNVAQDNSLTLTIDDTAPTLPTGVSFTAVGGNIVSDTLNISNTNFTASATVIAAQATGGSAELLKDGASFGTLIRDLTILVGDTSVTFDAGFSDNGAVQTAFAAGATLSVRLSDAAANTSTSTVANPAITVDYLKPTATVTVSVDPIYTSVLTQTVTATYTESMNNATAPTITMQTGGNWGLQAGGAWSQTSVLNDTYTATLTHDGTAEYIANEIAQVASTSGARDVNGNDDNGDISSAFVVDTEIPTAPTGVSFTAVGGNVVANTLNTSNMNFTASATITADQAIGGSAELLIDGASFDTLIRDTSISGGETVVNFDAGFSDNGAVQTAFAAGATLSVKLTDAAGNEIASSVANPTITVDYVKPVPTVTVSEDPIMTTNLTQTVTVTYTESMNASTTPTITMVPGTNWGVQAGGVWSQTSVLNDTYTATLTHDATP
ncbi:MAG: hypothetical protein KAI25_04125, partial [Hyphomicrobiaceae bacterium]|nr:hypothetical protein [Hyphomicrobiaceae bacterium]